jgi:hypothetical protein
MKSRHGRSRLSRCEVCLAAAAFGLPLAALLSGSAPAGASTPTLTVSPSTNLHDGESVSVSIGPNSVFTPSSRVNILECADPGGSVANLPKSDSTCDGNTIQGNTILVTANGSTSDQDYTIYLLPSPELGEQSNNQPICNQTNPCVLYVGQNQNDFTAPKVFSTPFTIAPATGGSTTTTPTTATTATTATTPTTASTTTASTTTASTATTTDPAGGDGSTTTPPPSAAGTTTSASSTVDPGVTLASTAATNGTALASTGVPADLEWVIGLGIGLLLTGSLGRRLIGGARR